MKKIFYVMIIVLLLILIMGKPVENDSHYEVSCKEAGGVPAKITTYIWEVDFFGNYLAIGDVAKCVDITGKEKTFLNDFWIEVGSL